MFNKFKKFLVFLLIIPIMFCFTACGKNKNSNNNPPVNPPSQNQGGNTGNESGGNENQGGENQGGENQGGENQGGENQGGENQGGENQGGENQGGEDDGNETQKPTTLTVDEFIEDSKNLNSKLPEKYVSKIKVENKDARIENYEQYVNIVYSTQGENQVVKVYSLLSSENKPLSYLMQEINLSNGYYTGVVVDEENKLMFYLGDFHTMDPSIKSQYQTFAVYNKLLEAISPSEFNYYFDGSFITKFQQSYITYINNNDVEIIKETSTSDSNKEVVKYEIILTISETESLVYNLIYEDNNLVSMEKVLTASTYTKTIAFEKDTNETVVELPDYFGVDYSQEYREI
ncbi:MAG: hypothetical protein IJX17_04685 [Clostridia bacterium]|nr:hypothetical protein [Clostridia bacterium]